MAGSCLSPAGPTGWGRRSRVASSGGGPRGGAGGRDPGRLAAPAGRRGDAGGDALAVQADVTSPADLERFVDAAVARWGRLDGLVNNAGKSAAGRIDQVSDDDWIADLNLKVLAAVR